jgi:nucleotide-binding universal stress UspA family protein
MTVCGRRERFAVVILVATDGSDQALACMRTALDLAAHANDQILVVAAWQELHATLGFPTGIDDARAWACAAAATTAALAEEVGLAPEISVRHGTPGSEICAAAQEYVTRMIVIGAGRLGTVAGPPLGSVSNYVVRHAPCPVLVFRSCADGIETSGSATASAIRTSRRKETT